MRELVKGEIVLYQPYFEVARKMAEKSLCLRRKGGSVIIKNMEIIAVGFNQPAGERQCHIDKRTIDEKVTDKTCCMHAEQVAMINALEKNPRKLKGSIIYFTSVDEEGNEIKSGKPYCTICSKMALHIGISEWILSRENGLYVYNSKEYNILSHNYKRE